MEAPGGHGLLGLIRPQRSSPKSVEAQGRRHDEEQQVKGRFHGGA